MKLWELVSVCRQEPHLLDRLGDQPEWSTYLELARRHGLGRVDLDRELPDAACDHVLQASGLVLHHQHGYVRVRSHGSDGDILPVVEVFRRWGGRFLEDVFEYGLVEVPGD